MTKQELINQIFENQTEVEDSVIVTENSVIVTVSVALPIDTDFHSSDYFIKQLKKKIPALDQVIVNDHPISVVMKIPMHGNERNNTVSDIVDLANMAAAIIRLIICNTAVSARINGISKDCKIWFPANEDKNKD